MSRSSEPMQLARGDADEQLDRLLHDLLTPISSLLLWDDVLRHCVDDGRRQEALVAIRQSAAQQARLVGDFRDMIRARRGKLALGCTRIDLATLVDAAAERIRADGRVAVEAAIARDAWVIGDKARLTQAIDRVVDDAIELALELALELAVHTRVIELQLTRRGGDVVLALRSPGLVSVAQSRTAPSIGLAVAHELVILHGGELVLDTHACAVEVRIPACT